MPKGRSKNSENWKLKAFLFPTTTPLPEEVSVTLRYHLFAIEIVVLLHIVRRTLGVKKRSDKISLQQLSQDIMKNSGEAINIGTGHSKVTVA
jgi:hypothetical protein